MRTDWQINTPADADFALSRLAYHERQAARIDAEADEQASKVERWRKRSRRRHDRRIETYRAKLVAYAAVRLEEQAPVDQLTTDAVWKRLTKKFSTPNGHVQARRLDARLELVDSSVTVRRAYGEWWLDAVLDAETASLVRRALSELDALGVGVEVKAPVISHEDVHVSDEGVVTLDGEVVPGVRFRPCQVKFDTPKTEQDAEHPAWAVPPEDSEIPVDVDDPDDEDDAE